MKKVIGLMTAAALAMSLCGCQLKKDAVKLSVWAPAEYKTIFESVAEEFAEKYSDEADFIITISEEKEDSCKGTIMSSPENAADIFVFADDQLDDLRSCGALLDVSADGALIDDYCGGNSSGAVLSSVRDGKYYAYPFLAGNGYFLYYNSEYFSEEDIKELDKILDICEKNNKHFAMDFSSGWYIYSFFKGAGLELTLNSDGTTNSCNWNTEKGEAVAEGMLDIALRDGFVSYNSDELVDGARSGDVIAGVSGTWNSEVLSEAYKSGYSAAKLPTYTVSGEQVQMASFMGYKLIGVSAYSEESEWAMKLAQELTNEKNQLMIFEERGECPANVKAAAYDEVVSSAAVKALSDQSEYAYTQLVADQYWDAAHIFGTTIASGNPDNRSMKELLDAAVERITASAQD